MRKSHLNQTYQYKKNTRPRVRRTKGGGKNGFKYGVIKGVENSINILDLKELSLDKSEQVLKKTIGYCIKNNEFPIRVITHNIIEKILMFKEVISKINQVESLVLDFSNVGSFTVVPKGTFKKSKR